MRLRNRIATAAITLSSLALVIPAASASAATMHVSSYGDGISASLHAGDYGWPGHETGVDGSVLGLDGSHLLGVYGGGELLGLPLNLGLGLGILPPLL